MAGEEKENYEIQNRLSDADGINQGYNTQGPSCRQPPFLETRNGVFIIQATD